MECDKKVSRKAVDGESVDESTNNGRIVSTGCGEEWKRKRFRSSLKKRTLKKKNYQEFKKKK